MALAQHLKNMTKDGLILLNQALGTMDYNTYMTKDELSVIIVDRINAQPPAPTQTHKHNTPTQTPPSALRAEVAAVRVVDVAAKKEEGEPPKEEAETVEEAAQEEEATEKEAKEETDEEDTDEGDEASGWPG